MAIEGITTLGESTLASGYTAGAGTMALVSGASFPAAGYTFSVRVNTTGAIYSCTRSSNTLTVTLESGSDVNLSSGAAVVEVVTARSLYDLLETFNRVGALANLPSTLQKAGQRYQTTDADYNYIFDGSIWRAIYGSKIVIPPVPGDFAWVNQGSATVSSANGGLLLTTPGAASINIRAQVATAPAIPFDAKCLVSLLNVCGGFRAGICFREAATGKFLTLSSGGGSTSDPFFTISRWTNATTFSTQPATFNPTIAVFSNGCWLRAVHDGTNITFHLSPDGFNWIQYYTEAKAAFFTTEPDQVGIFLNPESTAAPNSHMIKLLHFTF